jgi:hypothetical protein
MEQSPSRKDGGQSASEEKLLWLLHNSEVLKNKKNYRPAFNIKWADSES